MISTDLSNLADWCAGYARRNEPIPAHAAAHLAAGLMDLHERAIQMEIAPLRLSSPDVSLGFRRTRRVIASDSEIY